MKLKSIVFVMSCFLVLGLAGNASAVLDNTGEALTSGVDILNSWVETSNVGTSGPDTLYAGVSMNGGHLPGSLVFDFDVDNDTATGTGSIVSGIPTAVCGGGECKDPNLGEGWDFHVTLTLRPQVAGSTRIAAGCSGNVAQCTTRGITDSCTEGTCYELGTSCETGGDCYALGDACTGCSDSTKRYPMTDLCGTGDTVTCARTAWWGEWQVGYGQVEKVMSGQVLLPLGYDILDAGTEDAICMKLPWATVLSAVWGDIETNPLPGQPQFDLATALADPPKYQVTAMFNHKYDDGNAADDDQDFFRLKYAGEDAGFYLAIADWFPDATRAADGTFNGNADCEYNQEGPYGDIDVDASDVTGFLEDFGREEYYLPCPGCRSPAF